MLCRAVLRCVPCMNLNFPILRRSPLQGSRGYSTLSSFAQQPNAGQGRLILEVSTSHKVTRHSRWGFSGREIGPSQRLLPHHTKHLQQTDLLATGGIRTGNPCKRAAADLFLRPLGHWNLPLFLLILWKLFYLITWFCTVYCFQRVLKILRKLLLTS